MLEMPVREQKYEWSCAIDTACVAIEMLIGEHLEADKLLECVSELVVSTKIYKILPENLRIKAKEYDISSTVMEFKYLKDAILKATDYKVEFYEIKKEITFDDPFAFGGDSYVINPEYPRTKREFFGYIEKVMGEGWVAGVSLSREKQRKVHFSVQKEKKKILIKRKDGEDKIFSASTKAWEYLEKNGAVFTDNFDEAFTFEIFDKYLEKDIFSLSDFPNCSHATLIRSISPKQGKLEILDVNCRKYNLPPFYWIPYKCVKGKAISVFKKE